jgi:serine/threonine protein phosphatase PrpC
MAFIRRRLARSGPRPGAGAFAGGREPAHETMIDCAFATALGTRRENQDRCATSQRWVVLSDGAGGHVGGALAAEVTVEVAVSCLSSSTEPFGAQLLEEVVSRANEAVRARRQADVTVAEMAATLTVGIANSVDDDTTEWLVASIGDSPAWLVTPQTSTQVTEDDNVAAQLMRAGAITPAEAMAHPGRHWITRAIGPEDRVTPRVMPVRLQRGDALVICSDGLDVLDGSAIHQVIRTTTGSQEAAEQLVACAVRSGALDNVTAAVARHLPATCDRLGDEAAC